MVGAPRFELGTPSPPDRGGCRISLSNFANGCCFELRAINHLASALQTDLVLAGHCQAVIECLLLGYERTCLTWGMMFAYGQSGHFAWHLAVKFDRFERDLLGRECITIAGGAAAALALAARAQQSCPALIGFLNAGTAAICGFFCVVRSSGTVVVLADVGVANGRELRLNRSRVLETSQQFYGCVRVHIGRPGIRMITLNHQD
jgi:hypothetical protein